MRIDVIGSAGRMDWNRLLQLAAAGAVVGAVTGIFPLAAGVLRRRWKFGLVAAAVSIMLGAAFGLWGALMFSIAATVGLWGAKPAAKSDAPRLAR